MTPLRILTTAIAVSASLTLTLAGCALLPTPGTAAPSTPAPTAQPDAGEDVPSKADPNILVLSDDDASDVVKYTLSEPAGSFQIGPGVPPGFPAGVPVFTERWVKNSVTEGTTSAGLPYYSAMFWGDYADLDELAVHYRELGFDAEQQQDDTKRVIIYQNDRHRVIINATESAVNPQTEELIDPAYSVMVIFLD